MSRGLTDVPIVVAANKDDLIKETDREVSKHLLDISTKVKKAWKLNHVECSAKYNWNITNLFRVLAQEILIVRDNCEGGSAREEKQKCCMGCV